MLDRLIDLESLGWDDFFSESFEAYRQDGSVAGRIAQEHRGMYKILTDRGELSGAPSGKLRHESARREDFPAAGDWVAIQPRYEESTSTIVAVLPRKSQFVRGAAGNRTEGQVVAANIDSVFLMTALTTDFNLRRIERYLIAALESGAEPVIILSKSDLCGDPEARLAQVEAVAAGVPVHITSIFEGTGLGSLSRYTTPGKTIAVLGSSGVGKSTLINYLAGSELQRTQDVRADDGRGKHTTAARQLILLPGGGLVLDTPGMRELQLWDGRPRGSTRLSGSLDSSGINIAFGDIESLGDQCRYGDCSHKGEPDCAVQAALDEGRLDAARLRSYEKLYKEIRYQERKRDKAAEIREKNKWKKLCRSSRDKARTKWSG